MQTASKAIGAMKIEGPTVPRVVNSGPWTLALVSSDTNPEAIAKFSTPIELARDPSPS